MVTSYQRAMQKAEAEKARKKAESTTWWRNYDLWRNQGYSPRWVETAAIDMLAEECAEALLTEWYRHNVTAPSCENDSDTALLLSIPMQWNDEMNCMTPDPAWLFQQMTRLDRRSLLDTIFEHNHSAASRRRHGQLKRYANRPKRGKRWQRDETGTLFLKTS